jgi:hypothetical protein
MSVLWEELGRERYGVEDEKHLRFRYGVQVNSLGLTESQPENNVQRIVLEALAVSLGRNARARAIQLPAWNEALGLPRPWDQQWSLRIQQVLAYETDILEYPDIFEGSKVMEGLVAELLEGARAEMAVVAEHGGAVKAVDYMKAALVDSHRERLRRIEAGEQIVVGLNKYEDSEPSPLLQGADGGILTVDPEVEAQQRDAAQPGSSLPAVASLVLIPGVSRSAGNAARLVVAESAQLARIEIPLEPRDQYARFRIELRTRSGEEILTRNNLRAVRSSTGRAIVLDVPASALTTADYELTLQGVADGRPVDVGYSYFTVQKQ